jgi:hypothetical protein
VTEHGSIAFTNHKNSLRIYTVISLQLLDHLVYEVDVVYTGGPGTSRALAVAAIVANVLSLLSARVIGSLDTFIKEASVPSHVRRIILASEISIASRIDRDKVVLFTKLVEFRACFGPAHSLSMHENQ